MLHNRCGKRQIQAKHLKKHVHKSIDFVLYCAMQLVHSPSIIIILSFNDFALKQCAYLRNAKGRVSFVFVASITKTQALLLL